MLTKLLSHARHNVVAYLALFVAMGGTAFAAAKFTGADVVNDSLYGVDIVESSLVMPGGGGGGAGTLTVRTNSGPVAVPCTYDPEF